MQVLPVSLFTPPTEPSKAQNAARDFESLLIGQILRDARPESEDSSADCASDFATQQFATAIAQGGGLGIAKLIETALATAP